ncbi:LCP family protein [Actinoallomurus soli]|uniref:LCP family protein n=1 Tax=Actinoallomurus soli TaxID=2952535 RepID=UPI002091FEA7|nr:LCP family protein [Actinoallomurus soli]MCO5969990.1 LCP family protein [Actinoallomurus soli]
MLDVLLVALIGCCALGETGPRRVDAIGDYPGRPTWGLGQDWLIVLYDERRGDGPRRPAGPERPGAERRRVDTVMLLHLPSRGKPTLVDLPPDAYAPVAGHGAGSLRAAFAWGGPRLLVRTTESITHVGVERYAEIGLTGLTRMVDLAGGVRVCARPPVAATPAPAGMAGQVSAAARTGTTARGGAAGRAGAPGPPAACPRLSGARALAYLRTTACPCGDVDHAERQRRLVTALIREMTGARVALNPSRAVPMLLHGVGAVTIDAGAHLHDLIRLALTLRETGGLRPTTISAVSRGSVPGVGRVVELDQAEVKEIARALVTDCPDPRCPDR